MKELEATFKHRYNQRDAAKIATAVRRYELHGGDKAKLLAMLTGDSRACAPTPDEVAELVDSEVDRLAGGSDLFQSAGLAQLTAMRKKMEEENVRRKGYMAH